MAFDVVSGTSTGRNGKIEITKSISLYSEIGIRGGMSIGSA